MQILLLALPPNPLLFAAGDGFWLLLLLRLLAATAIGPTSVFASAAGLEETYMRTGSTAFPRLACQHTAAATSTPTAAATTAAIVSSRVSSSIWSVAAGAAAVLGGGGDKRRWRKETKPAVGGGGDDVGRSSTDMAHHDHPLFSRCYCCCFATDVGLEDAVLRRISPLATTVTSAAAASTASTVAEPAPVTVDGGDDGKRERGTVLR